MRLPVLAFLVTATAATACLAQMPTGQQSPAGQLPPGHPPIDQSAPSGTLHSGTVLETIPTGPYVYVRVKTGDGEQWLAAPATELKTGAKVQWPEGMLMANYHSKTLDRTFEQVFFVSKVEAAK
jgi:hypothetical protein